MRITWLSSTMLSLTLVATPASAEVSSHKNGLYSEHVSSGMGRDYAVTYVVDTVAELCFARTTDNSLAVIPCENLAKRPGWTAILTWLSPAGNDDT